MSKALHTIQPAVCACLAAAVLAACGGSSSGGTGGGSSSETVAKVGSHVITKTMLNQWMTEKIGEDFHLVAAHKVPAHLVSEPADYAACVASLKAITPIPGLGRPQPQPTVSQLTSKCKELYRAVKTQALAYLVSSYWLMNFDAGRGIEVTDEEVQQGLKRVRAEQYPKAGEFQRLLTSRRRTLSQELFLVRMELLQGKMEKKLDGAFFKEVTSAAASTGASCSPGYVVEYCKGYRATKASTASNAGSPGVLLEEIARWRPETSNGFTGVPVP